MICAGLTGPRAAGPSTGSSCPRRPPPPAGPAIPPPPVGLSCPPPRRPACAAPAPPAAASAQVTGMQAMLRRVEVTRHALRERDELAGEVVRPRVIRAAEHLRVAARSELRDRELLVAGPLGVRQRFRRTCERVVVVEA